MKVIADRVLSGLKQGKAKDCLEDCEKLIAENRDNPEINHLCALCYAQVKDWPRAHALFGAALTVKTDPRYLINYANACREDGKIEQALDLALKSKEMSPEVAEIRNSLGAILLDLGRIAEAEGEFREALSLNKGFEPALRNLAKLLHRSKRFGEAGSIYQELMRKAPSDHFLLLNFGLILFEIGESTKAAEIFGRILETDPENHDAKRAQSLVSDLWSNDLSGKAVVLERQGPGHAEYIRECYQDEHFIRLYNRFLPKDLMLPQLEDFLGKAFRASPVKLGSINWVIREKNDSAPVGLASLTELNFYHRRAEFLLGLQKSERHGTGKALEATLLIFDFAFNVLGLTKLISLVYAENDIASKNTESLGFEREALFREHTVDPMSDSRIDIVGYGMLEREFRANTRLKKLSLRLLGRDITRVSNQPKLIP